jgi:hypothetical protein
MLNHLVQCYTPLPRAQPVDGTASERAWEDERAAADHRVRVASHCQDIRGVGLRVATIGTTSVTYEQAAWQGEDCVALA